MDIVVRLVLDEARNTGLEVKEKLTKFLQQEITGNEKLSDVLQCGKTKVRSAVDDLTKFSNELSQKTAPTAQKAKTITRKVGQKIGDAGDKVVDGVRKGYKSVEAGRLYYQLGKLVYDQAVSRDYDTYTTPIVDKIRDISKVNGEEERLSKTEDECACETCEPTEAPETGDTSADSTDTGAQNN